MDRDKGGFFSENELALLEGHPDEIPSNHRSMYQDRLSEKVNKKATEVIEHLPEVVDQMEPSTKESLRLQTNPLHISQALGEIYTDQVVELILGILMSERQRDEPSDEFLERVDTVWSEVGQEVQKRVQSTQRSHGVRQSFLPLLRALLNKINGCIQGVAEWSGVKMRVPRDEFITWVVTEDNEGRLSEILNVAFGVTTNEPLSQRAQKYWELLSTTASEEGVSPPEGSEWKFDFGNPTEADYQRHEAALSSLDSELHNACHRCWEEKSVRDWDQLLAKGLEIYPELKKQDKLILQQAPCRNSSEGWTRYYTRRANILATDRQPPLLSRTEIEKSGTNEKMYELTDYGHFVEWLSDYITKKDGIITVIRDFASDVPSDIVEPALDELGPEDYARWVKVFPKYDISEFQNEPT